MQDHVTSGTADAARRAILCGLSLAGVVAAAVAVPLLGWPTGLGVLGVATLVLVVILLAAVPDDDASEASSDPAP